MLNKIFKHGVSVQTCLAKAGAWSLVSKLKGAGRAVVVYVVLEIRSFFSFSLNNFSLSYL